MSFYTDEQLSMILSAQQAAHYWSRVCGCYSWGNDGFKTSKTLAYAAEHEGYEACYWLEGLGLYDTDENADGLLGYLESIGLA